MSITRTPNHPAAFSGHFKPLAESTCESTRANQYGYVKTASYVKCGGSLDKKRENFEVQLVTNTALNNILEPNSVYFLSGKLIATNNGTTPIIVYNQESLIRTGDAGTESPDFTNKAVVTGLGLVSNRQEVVSDNPDVGSRLEVVVSHCDWDGEVSEHTNVSIPGTKNLIKTHSLYQVGREVSITGRLVDFDMDTHMAVVLVSSVSVTNGHQIGRVNTNHSSKPSSASGVKFPNKQSNIPKASAHTPSASPSAKALHEAEAKVNFSKKNDSNTILSCASSSKGKAKEVEVSDNEDDEYSDEEQDEEDEPEPVVEEAPKVKRGRPRKQILKEAAKRMKKF
ncbi:hypothetical protein PTTG_27588 [Puccinia triticina 1-1 BBBD Race 1]|uniref:Uncharacterized protein n=1 Tax=Puccinia triticina (isolate 1-1 / race 1 (BBBD)) TaxID=630390 RepID=A0A180GJP4_PUCT1|nr:hypothetical protein PTTG_27588 [Puccinia triticina 1-1 BBBD Race 1]